jgi:hypothetical protein
MPTCQSCGDSFTPLRAGAQYCSHACRTAAWRTRQQPPPDAFWIATTPELSSFSRSSNSDGSLALSNAELGDALVELAETADDGEPKTGRRYYYLALSHHFVRPSMTDTPEAKKQRDAAYKRVLDVLGRLRQQHRLDWSMVLDLTRELDQWQMFASAREARAEMRRAYDEDRWLGQPYFPILLVEKDTIEPVARPIAARWQMPFASSRGYGSLTLQHDVAELLIRRKAKTGQTGLIYFISDLDPSGLDLQRAWEEALESFGIYAEFHRVALTMAQVNALPNGQELGIDVKPSDSRAKRYVEQYGGRCWEADILPASTIERAIEGHLRSWLDQERWQQRAAEIEEGRKLL